MAMGEGGPELVKQLLSQTYDINMPGVSTYGTGNFSRPEARAVWIIPTKVIS